MPLQAVSDTEFYGHQFLADSFRPKETENEFHLPHRRRGQIRDAKFKLVVLSSGISTRMLQYGSNLLPKRHTTGHGSQSYDEKLLPV